MEGLDLQWRAEALDVADLERLHKDTESFQTRERRHLRLFSKAGWVVAAVLAPLVVIEAATILAQQISYRPAEPRFIEVDTATGWVGEATGARDAPRTFNERTAMHFLALYIENREGYLSERDNAQWRVVKAMSSGDELDSYNAWRKSELSPLKQLNTTGRVDVFNFSPDLHPTKSVDGSLTYVIRFNRREVKQTNVGQVKSWQATVVFQWHPERAVGADESQINPAGMVVVGYSAREL